MSVLRLDNVSHRYARNGADAVREVSLDASAGEVVALVGPNGAGKSTLLGVALEGHPTRGRVEWFGTAHDTWPRRELAKRVAYLAQSPAALPGQRVVDVLASGRMPYWHAFGVESREDREAVAAVAESLNVADLLRRPVDSLSGGQRQRVFLGRCLTQIHGQPQAAVLFDEPDTFLDLARVADLARQIRALATAGRAVLVASHDLNLAASVADRIVLLAGGEVVASGRVDDVLTPEPLSRAYGVAVNVALVGGRRTVLAAE